jgi:hypothetical protein
MIPALLAAILASSLVGLGCTVWLWTRETRAFPLLVLMMSLAVGLGFGLSACASFVSLSLFGASPHGLIAADLALLGLFTISSIGAFARRPSSVTSVAPHTPRLRWLLLGSCTISSVCSLSTFVCLSLANPHGQWDAWAIWNLRARFIARAGSDWRDAFTNLLSWSHPDYPLLLPLNAARLWQYVGSESQVAPMMIAMLFTFATVSLAWASLAILRNSNQAALAALLLLGTSVSVMWGASQTADIPLGFFVLATVIGLCLKDRLPERATPFLAISGMAAGLSTWTKNEGWLVLLSVMLARTAVLGRGQKWAAWRLELRPFLFGLAPVLIVVLYFKFAMAPPNDLVSSQGWHQTISRLLEPTRYVEVLRGLKHVAVDFRETSAINPLLALLFYLFCVGFEDDGQDMTGLATGLMMVSLMITGYILVYLTTPNDVAWHISSSARRLLLQLWPSTVFLAFLAACSPERSKG